MQPPTEARTEIPAGGVASLAPCSLCRLHYQRSIHVWRSTTPLLFGRHSHSRHIQPWPQPHSHSRHIGPWHSAQLPRHCREVTPPPAELFLHLPRAELFRSTPPGITSHQPRSSSPPCAKRPRHVASARSNDAHHPVLISQPHIISCAQVGPGPIRAAPTDVAARDTRGNEGNEGTRQKARRGPCRRR